MNTDTPITDENERVVYSEGNYGMGEEYGEHVVDSDIVRNLERKYNAIRKALEFYAVASNWDDVDTGIGTFPGQANDYGASARNALDKDALPV